jgi:hypothetical protein
LQGVVQQCRRPEVANHLTHPVTDHQQLRNAVVQLVLSWIESQEDFICTFEESYESALRRLHNNLSFRDFVCLQFKEQTWAEELFIKACACLIGIPIYVTSNESTRDNPYTVFSPWIGDLEVPPEYNHTPIVLGLINNLHFQSLLPKNDISTTCVRGNTVDQHKQMNPGLCYTRPTRSSTFATLGSWIKVAKKKARRNQSVKRIVQVFFILQTPKPH